jgi:hypothetical protein
VENVQPEDEIFNSIEISRGTSRLSPVSPRAIPTQINVVLNWFEELKAKVPAK